MVNKWGAIALFCIVSHALADVGESLDQQIQSIMTSKTAARSLDPTINCSGLRLDEKRVRFFLLHAKASSRHNYAQAYENGNCSASATVRFKGGRQIRLELDDGTGWGTAVDRRSTTYLYCEKCADLLDLDFEFK